MKPVYVDLHIHTSENPNQPNTNYPVALLIKKIKEKAKENEFLISLTDHNMVNKAAYIELLKITNNVILGVELHIKNYSTCSPYHCHIFFDLKEINEAVIDSINGILARLYPDKVVSNDTQVVPCKEDIIRAFDSYEFMLLPHGGQSHSTFETSFPQSEDVRFDDTLERNIYYNQFDGFTARGDKKLEKTISYFKRLGINEFVNLLTCTDNYSPSHYPQAKDPDASEFKPTWMFAQPTFQGLRLSLSESTRFQYLHEAPPEWAEYIKSVKLTSESLDIDVNLSPGLNVVIGGSSSGKTLFVDSLVRKLDGTLGGSKYQKFGINEIAVVNPAQTKPHYINQNYIVNVLSEEEPDISKIDMIKRAFPVDQALELKVQTSLHKFKDDISHLISSVERIESIEKELSHIPNIVHLMTSRAAKVNIIDYLVPPQGLHNKIALSEIKYHEYINMLDDMQAYLDDNPFLDSPTLQINEVKCVLEQAFLISEFESSIKRAIDKAKEGLGEILKVEDQEVQTKKQNKERLIELFREYYTQKSLFDKSLSSLAQCNVKFASDCISVAGHKLQIQNSFILNKDTIRDVLNTHLKSQFHINSFDEIVPESLFESKFSKQRPKVEDYEDFCLRVSTEFERMNERVYKITTREGKDFNSISPGWKCAVLIDIILGYDKDIAPIIIDQPEDNLATQYINHGLIDAIKNVKTKKQIILVSHNATIPMLGDAQNVVLCRNTNGKITIKSEPLEGCLYNKSMVDHIAEITDGGKASIKKRVKKYNLKSFREEPSEVTF